MPKQDGNPAGQTAKPIAPMSGVLIAGKASLSVWQMNCTSSSPARRDRRWGQALGHCSPAWDEDSVHGTPNSVEGDSSVDTPALFLPEGSLVPSVGKERGTVP